MAGGCVQLPVPAALLEISSINRLVDVASRIVSKHDSNVSQRQAAAEWRAWLSANIASEAKEEAHARWRQWQDALFALGLVEEHLAVALSARSKAFMVFMDTAARYGSGRLSLRVRPAFPTACSRLCAHNADPCTLCTELMARLKLLPSYGSCICCTEQRPRAFLIMPCFLLLVSILVGMPRCSATCTSSLRA